MKRYGILIAAASCAAVLAGCGKQAGGGDALDQQRKDVMGAPAPPGEQAKIAAMQAQQQQKLKDAQAASQKQGKP